VSNQRAARVGVIVPSSNTALEPEIAGLHVPPAQATFHITRVAVTTVTLDHEASAQFDEEPMLAAGTLLADAGLDALTWAGTSGSWLGVDGDRRLVGALVAHTGVPCTTSTLALLDACHSLGAVRVALITPYVGTVVDRIVANYAAEGIEVVAEAHLGISDNHAFGRVTPQEIWDLAHDCRAPGADALIVACTNLPATGLVPGLEENLGVPVLDSIAVTLRQVLSMAGVESPGRSSCIDPGGYGIVVHGSE
jgi:maleate isomerase